MKVVCLPLMVALLAVLVVSGCTQTTQTGEITGNVIDKEQVQEKLSTQPAACVEKWECGTWSECKASIMRATGTQERICEKTCSSEVKREERECELVWPKNALEINKTKRLGDFEVTLERIGFYTLKSEYDWVDDETYYRADIKVKNIGSSATSLSTYDAALIKGSTQYDISYNSEIETSNLRPGVIRKGYILFENVPLDISGKIRIDVASDYWHAKDAFTWVDIIYGFEVDLDSFE